MSMIEFITANIPTMLALVATGVFAGILAGLLGVGGGIVIVPVLFFLFQGFGVSPESAMLVATATSLATIVPTSISSIRSHNKKGNVDLKMVYVLQRLRGAPILPIAKTARFVATKNFKAV